MVLGMTCEIRWLDQRTRNIAQIGFPLYFPRILNRKKTNDRNRELLHKTSWRHRTLIDTDTTVTRQMWSTLKCKLYQRSFVNLLINKSIPVKRPHTARAAKG